MTKTGISYIDLAIVIILLIFLYKGFARGFTEEFMRIVGTLISLIVAIKLMSNLTRILTDNTNTPPIIATIISFTIIFVLTVFLFRFITDKLKKAISFSVVLGGADKIVGGAIGLLKGAIIVSLVTILLSIFSFSDSINRHITGSLLFDPMRRIAPLVFDTIKVFAPDPKPFITEFKENFSGISFDKWGPKPKDVIKFYQKK